MIVQNRCTVKVIDRHVEETLNLGSVQIHREHSIGTGTRDDIRSQLGGDRYATGIFAVLASVAKVRNHGGRAKGAARLKLSIMINSSIRLSFTGGQVG